MRAWVIGLSEFGDAAVLVPLTAVMLLWLLVMRSPRGAVWWAVTVAFCVSITALLKVSFYACPPAPDLHSPSGHTSFSTLVYGAMTLVTANATEGLRRIAAISGGTGFILAIAASRLLLHAHSAAEVGVGLVIGTSALALFGVQYTRYRAKEIWLFPLFVSAGALVLVLHRGITTAASHLLLHPDSATKVGVGLVIGTSALALCGSQFLRHRANELWLFPLFIFAGALMSVLHARGIPVEELLREVAGYVLIHCG
jgi:PAP2 superfamily